MFQYYLNLELLEEFSPVVERLGFDENFVDLTEMVEKRLQQLPSDDLSALTVSGHVYNDQCKWFLIYSIQYCVFYIFIIDTIIDVPIPPHFAYLHPPLSLPLLSVSWVMPISSLA